MGDGMSSSLHWASLNGHVEVVKSLIQAGGDVNMQSESGWTPLHCASQNGHVEVITALLAAGADKTIKTKQGQTPHDVTAYMLNQDCIMPLSKNVLPPPDIK